MRNLAIAGMVILTAIMVATFASADSVGIGIKKAAPLSGTGSSGSPLKITVCSIGQVYQVNAGGTAWECTTPASASGDIEGVTAGAGLVTGGTSGTVTLDVGAGVGIAVSANDVSLSMTAQDCTAGSFFDSNTVTGVFSCVAEVGDISTVTTTANMGLTGGGTSGAVTVGLLSTCADGEVLKSGGTGTTWSCAADSGGSYTAGDGLTLTGSDFDITYTSDFTITTDQLNLSTAVTAPGSLDVATDLTIGGGQVYFTGLEMNFGYNTNASTSGYLNYGGYLHGTTQFRDLTIADGKNATVATFTGSTKALALAGALNVTGLVTATAGVTTPANLTTTGTGDVVSADAITAGGIITGNGNGHYFNGQTTFHGSTGDSYFNYAGGDTYIRSGTAGSIVYVGDANTGGLRLGAASNPTTVYGSATILGDTILGDGNTDVVSTWGRTHFYGTAPTLSGCTASCTMASYSTDARGRITCTDSPATDCTVTFSVAYSTNAPACSITYEDSVAPTAAQYLVSVSTSALVFDVVGGAQAHAYNYRCDGML